DFHGTGVQTCALPILRAGRDDILDANRKDCADGERRGLSAAMLDRLALDEKRIDAMAAGVEAIAELPDPIGRVIAEWQRPNGLRSEEGRGGEEWRVGR